LDNNVSYVTLIDIQDHAKIRPCTICYFVWKFSVCCRC